MGLTLFGGYFFVFFWGGEAGFSHPKPMPGYNPVKCRAMHFMVTVMYRKFAMSSSPKVHQTAFTVSFLRTLALYSCTLFLRAL